MPSLFLRGLCATTWQWATLNATGAKTLYGNVASNLAYVSLMGVASAHPLPYPSLRCRKAALLHYPFSQSLNTNFQVLEPSQKLANGATSARLLGGLKLRPITHTHSYTYTHSRAHIQIDTHTHGVPTSGKTNCALVDSSTLSPSAPFNVAALRRQRNKAKKRKIHILFWLFSGVWAGVDCVALRCGAWRGRGRN